MKKKTRLLTAALIAVTPTPQVRAQLYKLLLGYRITKSRIGWLTIICVDKAEFERCTIGRKNVFIGPMSVSIRAGATIGNNNRFNCGDWTATATNNPVPYARALELDANSLITSGHHIDVAGRFRLGRSSWIAGLNSQFWTHGAGSLDRDIQIAESCYIGSAVRFAPGTAIGRGSTVGIGSVVTKKFSQQNVVIAGQPAKVVREKSPPTEEAQQRY